MKLRTILLVLAVLCFSGGISAQNDARAKTILDNIYSTYVQAKGVSIVFEGDQHGRLLLDGKCFMLDTGGVKSWFDGTTQWTYLTQNEEVNVSSPTPEELQTVNPFILLSMYKKGFTCSYQGTEKFRGQTLQRVRLVPADRNSEIKSIFVSSDDRNQIRRLKITDNSGNIQQIDIREYQSGIPFDITTFRFDEKEYPNAEVIDMR